MLTLNVCVLGLVVNTFVKTAFVAPFQRKLSLKESSPDNVWICSMDLTGLRTSYLCCRFYHC